MVIINTGITTCLDTSVCELRRMEEMLWLVPGQVMTTTGLPGEHSVQLYCRPSDSAWESRNLVAAA